MPLFACISGWLFYHTVENYKLSDIVKKKLCSLIIPIVSWVSIWMLLNLGLNILHGNVDLIMWIKRYLNMILSNFWFLWAIFICCILVLVIHYFFGDSICLYFFTVVAMMIIPDSANVAIGGAETKFLYPFFVTMYLIKAKKIDLVNILQKYTAFLLFAFLVMLCFYSFNTYIYVSGFDIYGELNGIWYVMYDLQRYFIGCVGSACSLLIVYKLYKQNVFHKVIAIIGRETIGIYILSSKIISGICYSIFDMERVNYLLDIVLTILIITICHIAIFIIKKIPIANKVLLGGI